MKLTRDQIINGIQRLNIKAGEIHNGWLQILCPFHPDKNLGNAGVNISNGVIHCFSCRNAGHILGVVMQRKGINYKEALNWIGVKLQDDYDIQKTLAIRREKKERVTNLFTKKRYVSTEAYQRIKNTLIDFDPVKYPYTKQRGFTKEFNNQFNIKISNSGMYKDYMIVPIEDNGEYTFEARKLCEEEYLRFFWKQWASDSVPSSFWEPIHLKKAFRKNWANIYKLKFDKKEGWFAEHKKTKRKVFDDTLIYLLRPKVLYSRKSFIKETLFDYKNLDYNEDLYIIEGIGGIPKVSAVLSKNVTTTYGVDFTPIQLKLLSIFKNKIIVIPNLDQAGDIFIWNLTQLLSNIWVIPITTDDHEEGFVVEISINKPIEAARYLIRKNNILPEIA